MSLKAVTYLTRTLLPLLSGLLLLVNPAGGQVIRGALIGGFNLSQVDGDEVFGYHKFGWNAGASAIIPVDKKKRMFVGLETLYNQKGSYQKPQYTDSASGEYRLLLNYAEVPVLFMYEDKDIITFGTGFSWARLVEVKEYEHGSRMDSTTLKGPYSRNDLEFLLDVRFKVYKQLKFNFRYNYSLAKIRTRQFNNGHDIWKRKQFNNVLSFRLIWVFNEKIKPKPSKKKTE